MRKLIFLLSLLLFSFSPSDQKLKVLYNSLDPKSISQHLAFYELYKNRPIGQYALQDAWALILKSNPGLYPLPIESLNTSTLSSIVSLVNKPPDHPPPNIRFEDLQILNQISAQLPHRTLKGHHARSESEVVQLEPNEIDIARGLFLSQFGSDFHKIRYYEAMIDLMALQILARLPPVATPEQKIRAINQFIFEEMGFRFPPHSLHCKDIDVYTFLPSVLDSHRGVCLGVSILYLCIAQRLSLDLEMITPPGHIYVRYRTPEKEINIETTARGIHIDSDEYLNINTRSLQQRNIKEVIGLAHMNQASMYLQKEQYQSALESYLKAEPYLTDDFLLKELLGYAYLFTGNIEKGKSLLEAVQDHIPDYAISKESIPKDYLLGHVDIEGIKTIFKHTEEDRPSILAKKQLLEETVKRCPQFRSGLLNLAGTWIELHRLREALEVLKRYHALYAKDPEVNYYMAILYAERMDYNKAWEHLRHVEKIAQARQYQPKILKELRKELTLKCPE